MGQPRASRRKVLTISSDEDEDENATLPAISGEEDEPPVELPKRSTGRLKSVKQAKTLQPPTSVNSTQECSSQKSPAKSKVSKAKAKPAVKDEPKAKAKPIYTFFNAAAQRQREASQPSLSPEKPSTPQEEPEAIDGGDDHESNSLAFSKGSSTALAVRKRKVHHSQSFEEDASLPPPATQKFRKTSDGSRAPSISLLNEDKRPWTEQFAPVDLSELAVHKKKVSDVRQWLETTYSGRRQKLLVLKGAAGTGKTTTVRLLAKALQAKATEWRNPAGSDYASEGPASAASQFEDFVSRAGKFGGLHLVMADDDRNLELNRDNDMDGHRTSEEKQLLLIEEFPNTFTRSSLVLQSFRSALMQYLSSPPVSDGTPVPLILIVSETLLSTSTAAADSFTVHRLLGPEILSHPYVDTLEFNAVAPTILVKALETVVIKEARKSGRRKTPGSQVLKRLAEIGDIRSAVSSLEFLCLRGERDDTWSAKVAFTKPKKAKAEQPLTKGEEEALRLISNRESNLGIFHSVGKVVYNKRTEPPPSFILEQPPNWLPQHRRTRVPETDVEQLIDELGTDTTTFVASLHENYALSCGSSSTEDMLDSLSSCIDSISDADLLSVDRFSLGTRAFSGSATDTLRQDELSFQVAVRGLLFNLPCPVHRSMPANGRKGDAHKMFYPASLKLWRKKEEIEGILNLLTTKQLNGDSVIDKTEVTAMMRGGVESWKQKNQNVAGAATSEASEAGHAASGVASSAKMEMLMDRLPYMASILDVQSVAVGSAALLNQVRSVTSVGGLGFTAAEDDEPDGDDDEPAVPAAEQWTTDKPEAEHLQRLKPRKHDVRKTATEGGGLHIPVESEIEKLVLEDDDIVDD